MCGIGGVVKFTTKDQVDRNFLLQINKTQKHRGPDANGIWISKSKKVGFAHSRLSILDTSKKANQPFTDHDKNYIISFNGEIYNFADIKKILVKKGHKFITKNSDTEVLLNSYKQWGVNCLKYFRGMFAFSIWDQNKKKLWLVRDRVGIKPLYYKIDGKEIVFASEIKSILLDKKYKREIDDESLFHYLTFCCSPAPKTMFKNIFKLEAGHYMIIDLFGKYKKVKYWDPIQNKNKKFSFSKNISFKDIFSEIKKSIKLRNIADVKTGIFLSGGIDSSTNAYLSNEERKLPINTFSIGYDKDYKSYKSELYFARMVSQEINSNHYEKQLSKKDLTKILEKVIFHQDEPISDPVCIPIYYLSKMATENNVKVCQVGEGADELFFGYTNWLRTLKFNNYFESFFFLNFFKKILFFLMKLLRIDYKYSSDLLKRSILRIPIFWSGAEGFTETDKKKFLSTRMKKKFSKKTSWEVMESHYKNFLKYSNNPSLSNWMTYADLKLRLPELLLMRIDKMSMAASLEGRVPFLDHVLVEKLIDLPENIKIKNNKLKSILKECVKDILPNEILNRKKQGFGLPLQDWFIEGLEINEKETIMEFVKQTDYFDEREMEKVLSRKKGETRIWFLLNLALWWKIFFKQKKIL